MDPTSWLYGTVAFPKGADGQPSQSPIVTGGILFILLTESSGPCLINLYDISAVSTYNNEDKETLISLRTGRSMRVKESVAHIAQMINQVTSAELS